MRWTPPITATQTRWEGGEEKNESGGPPQYLKCVDARGRKRTQSMKVKLENTSTTRGDCR